MNRALVMVSAEDGFTVVIEISIVIFVDVTVADVTGRA